MSELLQGKLALVTGSSRGIGRVDIVALAKAGADVVIADLLVGEPVDVDKLDRMSQVAVQEKLIYVDETLKEVRAMGRRAMAVRMDVANRAEVEAAFAKVKEEMGTSPDILVNNAAVFDQRSKFEDQRLEMWERDLRINLTGAFNCTQMVWTDMKAKGWGRVINMSSVAGYLGSFGQASYSASKAGIIGLTKTLALEGARFGITSNAIIPGPIRTEGFTMKTKLGIKSEMNERIINRTAMRRMGEPSDIANLVVFLASNNSAYLTGQAIPVAGGVDLFVF